MFGNSKFFECVIDNMMSSNIAIKRACSLALGSIFYTSDPELNEQIIRLGYFENLYEEFTQM